MQSTRKVILSGLTLGAALTGGSLQAATLKSLGYPLGTKQPQKPSFAADMKQGLTMTLDQLGCTWASRPLVYVFEDGIVFAAVGGTDYNAFTTATALSKGCWLPPAITQKSGYTDLLPVMPGRRPVDLVSYSTTTLAANGLAVPSVGQPIGNATFPAGFDIKHFTQNGVQLSQRQMNCTWAGQPFIYAFADGVIFTNSKGSPYNVYAIDDVIANHCWMPSDIVEGGPGDADVNTNGETDKEETIAQYIDNQNAAQQCLGRWRWTETWDEGYTKTIECKTTPFLYTVNVIDVDKGSVDGFPGVTKDLSTQVLTEDLGVAEATTRDTDSGYAGNQNDGKTLRECLGRVDEWVRTKSFARTVVNGFVVSDNPAYAGLFLPKPISVAGNNVQSISPVIQGAKCSDSKLGACVAYTSKRQCQVSYQNDYYTLNYHPESRTKIVQVDPLCKPKTEYVPVIKTLAGRSKLNTTFAQISQVDNAYVEVTKADVTNKKRSDYVCSSGVHVKDTASKYKFLAGYIAENKEKADIAQDPEFIAAVSTFWALKVEKSGEVANADLMGLANIDAVHALFPTAVFVGQSDADLGIDSGM